MLMICLFFLWRYHRFDSTGLGRWCCGFDRGFRGGCWCCLSGYFDRGFACCCGFWFDLGLFQLGFDRHFTRSHWFLGGLLRVDHLGFGGVGWRCFQR